MMRKRNLLVVLFVFFLFAATSCQIRQQEYRDDKIGQIAQRFFPKIELLPKSVESEFEYRKTSNYEGYFLKLCFALETEYEMFLQSTDSVYSDMTEEQMQHSNFIMDSVCFTVEDYEFRAIDMSEFGWDDEPFIGLIAHCNTAKTIVFLFFWNEFSTVEPIDVGLGRHGYMEFYTETWSNK